MNKKRFTYFLSILILLTATFAIYCFFFGTNGIIHAKTNFITTSGDYLKDFYNTYYHVKYDTSYLYNNTMNYPYGEHFTFTGENVYISFPLKLIKNIGLGDYSAYILLIMNLHVLLSFLLCALFLYLLFRELKISTWVACLAAIAITFLSPQIMRMWGHLTLIYMFILPAMLYFFYKIYQKQQFGYAIGLGILTFWASMVHAYYFLFFFIFNVLFWSYLFIVRKKENLAPKRMFYLICIQIVAPAILFFLLTNIGITDHDRTKIPFGFYAYKGWWETTFVPQSYWSALNWSESLEKVRASYIGTSAVIMFIILVVNFCIKLVRRRFTELLKVTDNQIMNLFFWISFITLLFSYGYPMLFFETRNFVFLGPLAQIRDLSRYQWLFFYLINIITVYYVYHFVKEKISKKWLQFLLAALVFCAYAFEVYNFNRYCTEHFNKECPEMTDYNNTLEMNQWVQEIDTIPFQSMLVLPFFHVGSEHIWIEDPSGILRKVIYVSMKTGIPMHNCCSSRTSLSKTYNNVPFYWLPPVDGYPVLKDMYPEKPILLLISSNHKEEINENGWRIVNYATYLFSANDIDFYKIDVPSLEQLCKDYYAEQQAIFMKNKVYQYEENLFGNEPEAQFFFKKWNNAQTFPENEKKDGQKLDFGKSNHFFCEELHFQNTDSVEVSFWVSNYTDDFIGRSDFYLSWVNGDWDSNFWDVRDLSRNTTNLYHGWAHARVVIPYFPDYPILSMDFVCKYSRHKDIFVDFILIRPIQNNILYEDENMMMLNNKIVKTIKK